MQTLLQKNMSREIEHRIPIEVYSLGKINSAIKTILTVCDPTFPMIFDNCVNIRFS